jgi:hypothetical protein
MASANAFKYCGELLGRYIRLLEVRLGSELSTLEIRLIQESLDEERFEALSYVLGIKRGRNWSNTMVVGFLLDLTFMMPCGRDAAGQEYFCGLMRFASIRRTIRRRLVQVCMMRDIYAIAERVII